MNIDTLILDGSPRLEGENEMHSRVLAEAAGPLPPIVVHQQTMRVIDGVHRVRAAKLRGERTIMAVFFEGEAKAAFVYAVMANITHGLPLSLADRRVAAERILEYYPGWSDRALAAATGLSASTIRGIRDRTTAGSGQLNARMGRDGKARPLDTANRRRRAAEVIADRPGASLREIASSAGLSIGTARDVRRRVHNGDDPVPSGGRPSEPSNRSTMRGLASREKASGRAQVATPDRSARQLPSILEGLRSDPALRYSESGRRLVRWLFAHFIDAGRRSEVAESVPPHCAYVIAELAIGYAHAWEELAEDLIARVQAGQPS